MKVKTHGGEIRAFDSELLVFGLVNLPHARRAGRNPHVLLAGRTTVDAALAMTIAPLV